MSNNDNLINLNDRPEDEARAIRSKGGKARAEQARARATMREIITAALETPYMREDTSQRSFDTGETDYYHELAYQIMQRALSEPRYTEMLLQIVGDMPDKDAAPDIVYGTVNIEWDHGEQQRECNEENP